MTVSPARVVPIPRDHDGRASGSDAWRRAAHLPVVTLLIACSALVAELLPGAGPLLEWHRAAVAKGELWRLVTAHLVHFGWAHLAYDVGAWLLLAGLSERRGRRTMVATLAVAAALIPLAVAVTRPDLLTYRGLSGLDSALFALLVTDVLRDPSTPRRGLIALVAVGFVAKLLIECSGTGVFVVTETFVPVPIAHAVGALVGLAMALKPRAHPRDDPGRFGPVADDRP